MDCEANVSVFLGMIFVLLGLFSLLRHVCIKNMQTRKNYELAKELAIKFWFWPNLKFIEKKSIRLQARHDDSKEKIKIENLKEEIKKVRNIDTSKKTIAELKELIDHLEEARRNILYR